MMDVNAAPSRMLRFLSVCVVYAPETNVLNCVSIFAVGKRHTGSFMVTTSFMRKETIEASAVVSRLLTEEAATIAAIKRLYEERKPRVITTAARGSSDHAASFFKYLFEISVGLPVASIGPSVTSVYNSRLQLQDGLYFTVSQSGTSPGQQLLPGLFFMVAEACFLGLPSLSALIFWHLAL